MDLFIQLMYDPDFWHIIGTTCLGGCIFFGYLFIQTGSQPEKYFRSYQPYGIQWDTVDKQGLYLLFSLIGLTDTLLCWGLSALVSYKVGG